MFCLKNIISAYKSFLQLTKRGSFDSAAFRTEQGWAYTHKEFNSDIKSLLQEFLPYGHNISGHSFRAGLASLLAQAGYGDDKIKAIGRWSSKAFQNYIKLPALTRVNVASRLAAIMT